MNGQNKLGRLENVSIVEIEESLTLIILSVVQGLDFGLTYQMEYVYAPGVTGSTQTSHHMQIAMEAKSFCSGLKK